MVIVNDGSEEKCDYIFEAVSKHNFVKMVSHAVNIGKGAALKTGINYILNNFPSCQSIVTADADGQHHPDDILKIVHLAKANYTSLILGCRSFDEDIPLRSKLGNNISKVMYSIFLGLKLQDTQTGLRALPIQLARETLKVKANRYELETEQLILASRMKLSIVQESIQTIYEDNNSSSHFNPVFDSIRIYYALFRYVLSSIATALVDFIAFIMLNPILDNLIYSNLGSRAVALFVQFFLLKNFVFKAQGRSLLKFIFFIVYVAAIGLLSGTIQSSMNAHLTTGILFNKILVESFLFIFNFLFLRDFLFKSDDNA